MRLADHPILALCLLRVVAVASGRRELASRYEVVQTWPFTQVYPVHPQPPPADAGGPGQS